MKMVMAQQLLLKLLSNSSVDKKDPPVVFVGGILSVKKARYLLFVRDNDNLFP